jgi:hypothetical protein
MTQERNLGRALAASAKRHDHRLEVIPWKVYCHEVSSRYVIELEPEVRDWLETLRLTEYAKVEAMADILADRAETLGEPYSRHLGGKTRELRFYLDRAAVRISYWLAPGARVVLLTVFRKTRQVERAEVARAIVAQQTCESGHEAHAPATETFERKWR